MVSAFCGVRTAACIRVTYSRGNWRNWWIMVPRHAGYFEAMFRFASRQRELHPTVAPAGRGVAPRQDYALACNNPGTDFALFCDPSRDHSPGGETLSRGRSAFEPRPERSEVALSRNSGKIPPIRTATRERIPTHTFEFCERDKERYLSYRSLFSARVKHMCYIFEPALI